MPKRSDTITFVFSVAFAGLFWVLNALNKSYESRIRVNVAIDDIPQEKALADPLPDNLEVTVSGPGWDLMSYQLRQSNKSLVIPYENVQGKNYLLTGRLRDDLSALLSQDIQILDVQPDSLPTRIQNLTSKYLVIKPRVRYQLPPGFGLSESMRVEPSFVELKGPSSLLDTLQTLPTEAVNLGKVRSSVERQLDLKLPEHPALVTPTRQVTMYLPAERLTEAGAIVPVEPKPQPQTLDVYFIPAQVEVTYKVALSRYNEIVRDSFRCVAHLPQVLNIPADSMQQENTSLEVELVKKPRYIYDVKLQPPYVEYIIESKQ
jgi:hypothetical protein